MIEAFRSNNANTLISASTTTASASVRAQPAGDESNIRIVNPSTLSVAFVNFSTSGVTATTANFPVLPLSERIFKFPRGATHAAVILDTGTATIYAQVGRGV